MVASPGEYEDTRLVTEEPGVGGQADSIADVGISTALLAACYDDIRRIARHIISRDGPHQPLQATELANEAAIRLMGVDRMEIRGKGHMLAMAARTMRRVLIDEARKAGSAKRRAPTLVTCWPEEASRQLVNIEDLDRGLEALGAVSAEHAQVVELRFMLGLTVEETSRAIGVAERTVKRRWQAARAWLLDYLDEEGQDHAA